MKTNYPWKLAMNGIKRSFIGLALAAGAILAQPAMAAGPAPVDLLSCSNFTILAGTTVTYPGSGTIYGDVGLYPGAGSAMLIPPVRVIGMIYESDATGTAGANVVPNSGVMLNVAKNNLTTAYNDAAGRTPVDVVNPGAAFGTGFNIGGLTLAPGLYKFAAGQTAYIYGSDLTLSGGPDDVWIFQCAVDLQVEPGVNRSVILAGGAQAKNVFWQVGTAAILGTYSTFKGTIMAGTSITMDVGGTMEGRALAFAQVTFTGSGGSLPKSSQTITNFIPTNSSTFVAATNKVGLSAQASSVLPVSFAVLSGPGVITGGTNLALASTGVVSVVASQAGDMFFSPAPNVTNTYIVTGPLPAEPGWLAIQVTPIGGNWQLTAPVGYAGPTAGTGNLAAVSAVVGEYGIAYGPLSGYVAPNNQTQFVVVGVTSLFTGVYVQVDPSIASPVVTATEGTYTNKVRISWPSVPGGITGYEIWKSQTNNVTTAARIAEVPDFGEATFLYDDYDVVPARSYYYWGLAKKASLVSPMSLVSMGYASLTPPPDAPRADIAASDMVYLPVNATNLTTAGTVSFRIANLGPAALNTSQIAFDFRIGLNNATMVALGSVQRAFNLAVGQEQLVILTAQEKLGLVIPATISGIKQVQVTLRHASPVVDPNLANNMTTAVGAVLVRAAGINSPDRSLNDYDGDGKSDGAVYRDSDGRWVAALSGYRYQVWLTAEGGLTDLAPVPGDYDGDGITDVAVYNRLNGWWTILLSFNEQIVSGQFGGPEDMPMPCDFDGDSKTDPVVYHGADGYWYGASSADGYALEYAPGPWSGYSPAPGDYDGDGKADPASCYNEQTGMWVISLSSRKYVLETGIFGGPGWIAASADYDGDGLTDPAIYNPSTAEWQALLSGSLATHRVYTWWGGVVGNTGGGNPVPADYDGDGKADPAVYHQDTGLWELFLSARAYLEYNGLFGGPRYQPTKE